MATGRPKAWTCAPSWPSPRRRPGRRPPLRASPGPRARPGARPRARSRPCQPALDDAAPGAGLAIPIRNVNRTVGTLLGAEVTRRYGGAGLPDGTIDISFTGSAGQSFGAFLPGGITLRLEGDANDYLGKGLSGGRLIVRPSPAGPTSFVAEEQIIAGNVILYGATAGEAFIRGVVGERFAVRNSGAVAVVEGVGDHGCEYMTGGRVVVLGPTGRNFGAGMSGGIAYVWDPAGPSHALVNPEMVDLEECDDDGRRPGSRRSSSRHRAETGSEVAERVLARWPRAALSFAKVMPRDYRRVLEAMRAADGGRRAGRRRRSWRRRMGKPTGFLEAGRELPLRRPVPVRLRDWREVYEPFPADRLQTQAGRCMDCGIPVLQRRLPARQPHPGLERPRLPRPVAGRHRAPARHQQLPGVHRAPVPGAVRVGLRARHQRRPGHHQAGRGVHHRPGVGRRLGGARPPSVRVRASGWRSSALVRPGWPRPSN